MQTNGSQTSDYGLLMKYLAVITRNVLNMKISKRKEKGLKTRTASWILLSGGLNKFVMY